MNPQYGLGMVRLAKKLKLLKGVLQRWNKEVFGWTGSHIQRLEERVHVLELNLQNGPSEDIELDLVATKVELATWVSREETRLHNKLNKHGLRRVRLMLVSSMLFLQGHIM